MGKLQPDEFKKMEEMLKMLESKKSYNGEYGHISQILWRRRRK